jgi:hypothetical protein
MSSARALNTASLRPEKSGFCRPLFLSQRRCIIFNCLEDHPSAGERERDAPATRRESCAFAEQEEDVVPFAGKRRLIVFGSENDVYAAALSPARKEQITRQRRLLFFFLKCGLKVSLSQRLFCSPIDAIHAISPELNFGYKARAAGKE